MTKLPKAVCLIFALALVWVSAGALAQQEGDPAQDMLPEYSAFYVFGGSLADAGTYLVPIADGVAEHRWTVNPALVWNQHLGEQLGLEVTANIVINTETGEVTQLGGTNYAQGGARVKYNPGDYDHNTLSLSEQVDVYLASTGGQADPDALYALLGGANDIIYQGLQLKAHKISFAQAKANTAIAAGDLVVIVGRLIDAGARHILVFNGHNIGKSPVGAKHGILARIFFKKEAKVFNKALEAGLAKLDGDDIIYVDLYEFMNKVVKHPGSFGFANAKAVACSVEMAINCTLETILPGASATTYFFADQVHPTGPGHVALSEYVRSLIVAAHAGD